ncbi:MAG: hypothetical protein NVS1B7_0270 [Candidatus Saccharimonadales bacterium]
MNSFLPQEIMSGGTSISKELLGAGSTVLGLTAIGGVLKLVLDKIPEGHAGLRTHGDRARIIRGDKKGELYRNGKVVRPGFHAVGPIIGGIKHTSINDRVHELEPVTINNCDGQLRVEPTITWGIIYNRDNPSTADAENLYKAMFDTQDEGALTCFVKAVSKAGVLSVVGELESSQIKCTDMVQERFISECNPKLSVYGCSLKRLEFNYAFTEGEMLIQAMKSASAVDPRNIVVATDMLGLRAVNS